MRYCKTGEISHEIYKYEIIAHREQDWLPHDCEADCKPDSVRAFQKYNGRMVFRPSQASSTSANI